MKLLKNFNAAPEKGVLLILRIGAIVQTALAVLFLIAALITKRNIMPELSSIITLAVSLLSVGILLTSYQQAFAALKGSYLIILIGFETLTSIALPLLFTSHLDKTEFFIAFWVLIPSAFIPLSIVGLQYNYLITFFYSLCINLLDYLMTVFILLMHGNNWSFITRFTNEHDLLRNIFLRFIFMVMMGHIISVMVSSIRKNASELAQANQELEEFTQHLEERVLERTQAMEATNQKTLEGWVRLMELRRLEPVGHTERMISHGLAFGEKLNLNNHQLEILKTTILLHDVGKLGIPDQILLKQGSLTDQEFSHSKLHVEYGVQILSGIDFLHPSIEVIAAHHEHWNGSGYPKGLQQKEIPFLARVFSVIEVFDVLTHDTVYRKAWNKSQARKYLLENSGVLFDPLIITQFMGLLETQELDNIVEHL